MIELAVGNQAPLFSLKDQDGKDFEIRNYIGKFKIVLFFYPKDNSAGCTAEACSFRDSYQDFQDLGAKVIGISKDSKESHQGFISSKKLPFPLLTDADGAVHGQYGVKKSLFLIPGRYTFLIGLDGKIKKVYNSAFNMSGHQKEMLDYLKNQKK